MKEINLKSESADELELTNKTEPAHITATSIESALQKTNRATTAITSTPNHFTFCPNCASTKIQTAPGGRKWFCPDCGFDLYNNVAAAVGIILQDEEGRILFEKRAKEPRKGYLALPGGFSEADESAEDACRRECFEETGLEISDINFLCTFPNTYQYKTIVYKTCDIFFTGRLPEKNNLHAQKSEVSEFVFLKIENMADLEKAPLAFDSARKCLQVFLQKEKGSL